jgi:hypothetical protein
MLLAKDLTQESDLQNGQKLMVSTRLLNFINEANRYIAPIFLRVLNLCLATFCIRAFDV